MIEAVGHHYNNLSVHIMLHLAAAVQCRVHPALEHMSLVCVCA